MKDVSKTLSNPMASGPRPSDRSWSLPAPSRTFRRGQRAQQGLPGQRPPSRDRGAPSRPRLPRTSGCSAPVGQMRAHWPQLTHSTWSSSLPKEGTTTVWVPLYAKSMAPTDCTSEQMRTQSPQRTHLFGSRTSDGDELSRGILRFWFLNRTLVMPRRRARAWSWQVVLFWQVGQFWLWFARRSSTMILRIFLISSVFVLTFIPWTGGVEQAGIRPMPSTSTIFSLVKSLPGMRSTKSQSLVISMLFSTIRNRAISGTLKNSLILRIP